MKQEVDGDLSVCVDECSPCGLSITGDIKIHQFHVIKKVMTLLPRWRGALSISIKELFLLPKLDNNSPSVTRDKEIVQGHMI